MRAKTTIIMVAIVLVVTASFASALAKPQGFFSLSGKIISTTRFGRFTIKLYPPLNSGKSVLLTTSLNSGEFQFTNIPSDSYLLEVFSGKRLVYQEVIKLDNNKSITIDLRRPPSRSSLKAF
jgi:hypothetical protein